MAINNEAVKLVADQYVQALAAVKADDTNTKWFPSHDDDVTKQVRSLHETLGEFWRYGQVR